MTTRFKILSKRDILPDSIIQFYDGSPDDGLIVLFESDSYENWIGIFNNGRTNFTKITALANENVLVIANGLVYLINPFNKTVYKFQIEYCDLKIQMNRIFLASFSFIDIYNDNRLLKSIYIDDIDGIRFKTLNNNKLRGEFRQIDQMDFNIWIPFELDTLSLDFNCDYGLMWKEYYFQDGKRETKYMTRGLKR